MKDILIRITELIEEFSVMCRAQIDSSKFIRDPLEQLLPKNMKKGKKLKLLITAPEKDVCAVFAVRCLPATKAMDVFKNELYDETYDTEDQMNSSHIEQNSGDMWRNSKTFHGVRIREAKSLSYGNERERQKECHPLVDYLFEIIKDPFLDICSFVNESKVRQLQKRALVTKDTNITAKVYKNRLAKGRANDIQIHHCKSN